MTVVRSDIIRVGEWVERVGKNKQLKNQVRYGRVLTSNDMIQGDEALL